jgi:maltose alpha-D-glucosyltransferase/alpha-amylase
VRHRTGDAATWYKDAIFYELRTRSFFDSNDDGVGDLQGLTGRLGYLADLGVTAIWLLPFYPSPGKDDGYDIASYTDVHPDIGTLADFDELLSEAHRRDIRVVTELVLNHTSDQHPWFQRARRAPKGSSERDFYVWTDSPHLYREARVIFKDFEPSNWSWDREAGQYFWHRFYAHQPDLNFENPAVHDALLQVVDFWLGRGVDGLRLDAVPYLYEEEGTSCENLPETHVFLKKLRKHIDERYPNRVLLAEANQWPEDAAAYFGAGDECHMNFHFPLMPRMFMALHMEDRFPIVDIFAQTPEVHPSCQWGLFLRNHDELTLEMVTDEERDAMYRAYADDTAMRINLGIRRRLAPLVGNDRRRMELLNGLLLSLPGTPFLYYGDEIGMGDNVYLGDRNGVRTPMQWSADRNAGFSRANPQRLILPVVIDPQFHYESVNVENQQQNASSWLWWMKRMISLRKRFAAFGRGTTEYLSPSNPHVLAFVRAYEGENVLVVANLSRFPQHADLDLSKWAGASPVELLGRTRFPRVGETAFPLSLGGHGFYWFSLERPKAADERISLAPPPPAFECASLDALLGPGTRDSLDDAATAFLAGRPWFLGRDRATRSVHVDEVFRVGSGTPPLFHLLVRVAYLDSTSELYSVPLVWVDARRAATGAGVFASVRVTDGGAEGVLVDAMDDPVAARTLLEHIGRGERWGTNRVALVASVTDPRGFAPAVDEVAPRPLGASPAVTKLRFGDRLVLRLVRHLDEGADPAVELSRFLAKSHADLVPPHHGGVDLVRSGRAPTTVASVEAFVAGATSAWKVAADEVHRFFERVLAAPPGVTCPLAPTDHALVLAGQDPPPVVREMIGSYRETAAQIGARVAELHLALAGEQGDPAFAAEPYSALDRRSKYQSLRNLCALAFRKLRERLPVAGEPARAPGEAILAREGDVLRSIEPLLRTKMGGLRIRSHGDLHLGHVLVAGKSLVFTGIGGDPALPIEDRRRKRSPLRDVAWMVRSLELAILRRLFDPASVRTEDLEAARPWAVQWSTWTAASFVGAYLAAVAGASFLPADRGDGVVLFDAFLLERLLHQLRDDADEHALSVAHLALTRMLERTAASPA